MLVVVEGLLDLLETREMRAAALPHRLEIRDDRFERAMLAEEDPKLERVLVHRRVHLFEPGAHPFLARFGDAVERLVGTLCLAHAARGGEAVVDELSQHGIELRLRGRPEEADAPLRLAKQVVAGTLA